jgi:hypothetical protein
MSDKGTLPREEEEEAAWERHNFSQLKHFQSLSLREKLESLQGMADVVRRLREMRTRGELSSSSGARPSADMLSQSGPCPVMRMTPIDSAAIARAGYDPAKRVLRIQYTNGRAYDYLDVPPSIYEQLMNAESAGEFVNRESKPSYESAEVE